MTANQRYRAAENVHARRIDDEIVLLDLNGGAYFALNEQGAEIWERLSCGKPASQVADEMEGLYDTDRDTLLRDIETLIERLHSNTLLVLVELAGGDPDEEGVVR